MIRHPFLFAAISAVLVGCGPESEALLQSGSPEVLSAGEAELAACTDASGYCDVSLRAAITTVMSDGRLYAYEVSSLYDAVMDGVGVSATETRDLETLLRLEKDRIEPEAATRIGQGLAGWNWRRAMPEGVLAAKLVVTDLYTLWLRGTGPQAIRLTLESPSQLGPRTEGGVWTNPDGTFGTSLVGAYLTNDGRVALTRDPGSQWGGRVLDFVHLQGSPAATPLYENASLRTEIDAALSDGRLYDYESGRVLNAALADDVVDAVELGDLRRLLTFEKDRIERLDRFEQFLQSCNWRQGIPDGPLDLVATVRFSGESSYAKGVWHSFERRFHLRGSKATEVRLTIDAAGSAGEWALSLQDDGRFVGAGLQGWLTNDGGVFLQVDSVIRYGPGIGAVWSPAPQ